MGKKLLVLGFASLLVLFLGPTINSQVGPNAVPGVDTPDTGTTVTKGVDWAYNYEIKRFRVTSTGGGFVLSIQDAGMPTYPDWWEATIYQHDNFPYKIVTLAAPATGKYTGAITCYSSKGGANTWYVEVRYHKGCYQWVAGCWVKFSGPGTLTVTELTTAP